LESTTSGSSKTAKQNSQQKKIGLETVIRHLAGVIFCCGWLLVGFLVVEYAQYALCVLLERKMDGSNKHL